MDELNKDRPINLTGNIEADLSSMLQTSFGEETTEYLAQWTTISQLSLKANRLILQNCLTKDEENYISCRFCGEGIPNWKQENAREHTAECPINNVSEVLIAVKKLKRNILENTKQDNIHEQNSTMPGRSIQ
jgi:hypothetical protein